MSNPDKHAVQVSVYFFGMPPMFLRDGKIVSSLCEIISSLLEADAELIMDSKVSGKMSVMGGKFNRGAKFIFRSVDIEKKTFQCDGNDLIEAVTIKLKPISRWPFMIKQSTRRIF